MKVKANMYRGVGGEGKTLDHGLSIVRLRVKAPET